MANSHTTADIVKGVLHRAGESTTGDSERANLALKSINRVYTAILAGANEFELDLGEPFSWCRETEPRTFVLQPAYETGTVSLTQGSVNGTFSSAPAAGLGSFAGRYLTVAGRSTRYRIATHTAGASAFTLKDAYLEDTGTTLSFIATKLEYDLGEDICRLVEPIRHDQVRNADPRSGQIYGIDLLTFRRDYPLRSIGPGIPSRFAVVSEGESSTTIIVNAYIPSTETGVLCEFDYVKNQPALENNSNSIPLIPVKFRVVLEYGGAFFMLLDRDSKKAQTYFGLAQNTMRAMIEDQHRQRSNINPTCADMIPRADMVGRGPAGYE